MAVKIARCLIRHVPNHVRRLSIRQYWYRNSRGRSSLGLEVKAYVILGLWPRTKDGAVVLRLRIAWVKCIRGRMTPEVGAVQWE